MLVTESIKNIRVKYWWNTLHMNFTHTLHRVTLTSQEFHVHFTSSHKPHNKFSLSEVKSEVAVKCV